MGTRVLYIIQAEEKSRGIPPSQQTPIKRSIDEDTLEGKMAQPNTSYNIPRESSLLCAKDFITGAGAVMFHRKSKRVVLVIDTRQEQFGWFLPKGRRDIGETFEQTAVREGEEEGGYPCRLLPVPVPTRHPKKVADGDTLSTEPIYMHNWAIPTKRSWKDGGMYTCFWYVCEITDEDVEKVEREKQEKEILNRAQMNLAEAKTNTGKVFMDYHELGYRSELFGYEEANKLIAESIDSTVFGCVLGTAIELVQKLDAMETTD
ncbi:hypothetical protein TWF730_006995 [Orbilia blumenaviensis]|uniref:Nudix hydrolase domain-containing protein n=1 Tax=Orbilia blumenaviensis TaxID=1796055 RepID=A0AAV9VGA0_9PEZI